MHLWYWAKPRKKLLMPKTVISLSPSVFLQQRNVFMIEKTKNHSSFTAEVQSSLHDKWFIRRIIYRFLWETWAIFHHHSVPFRQYWIISLDGHKKHMVYKKVCEICKTICQIIQYFVKTAWCACDILILSSSLYCTICSLSAGKCVCLKGRSIHMWAFWI